MRTEKIDFDTKVTFSSKGESTSDTNPPQVYRYPKKGLLYLTAALLALANYAEANIVRRPENEKFEKSENTLLLQEKENDTNKTKPRPEETIKRLEKVIYDQEKNNPPRKTNMDPLENKC